VGRDLLVRGVATIGFGDLHGISIWVDSWPGQPPLRPEQGNWEFLLGLRFQIGRFFDPGFVFFALLVLFLFLGLRLLLRREWLAVAAVLAIQAGIEAFGASPRASLTTTMISLAIGTMWWSITLFVTVRFGLLATAFFLFVGELTRVPANWGLTGWQSSPSWTAIVIVTAVTVYGFHTALAGRSLFRDDLLEG